MRLFLALDIDDNIRRRIVRFIEGVREFAPDARWVRPESLHVTLKFIGEKSADEARRIKQFVKPIAADGFEIKFRGYGFFPTARAARVFWVGIEAGEKLPALATAVDESLAQIGIAREEHAFNPHLTLARGSGRSGSPRRQAGDHPNRSFQRLQEKLGVLSQPEFGAMTARELCLYESTLSPTGSRYTKLEGFALR